VGFKSRRFMSSRQEKGVRSFANLADTLLSEAAHLLEFAPAVRVE
jgi:hypothetical protein